MFRLLVILGVLTPFSFGYRCYYYGSYYSTGYDYTFNSPNYPRSFPRGIQCDWEVSIPNAESITVQCQYFNLRATQNCEMDYLQISRDGKSFQNSVLYCGKGYLKYTVYTNIFKAQFGSEYRRYKSNNELENIFNRHYNYYDSYGFKCQLSYTEVPTASESDAEVTTTSNSDNEVTTNPESESQVSEGSTTGNETSSCECGIKNSGNTSGRIVGGGEATMNEYPWQCMLRTAQGYHYCGCSLINNKYILTASHCVVDGDTGEVTNPEDIIVSLGDYHKYTQDETDKTIHMGVVSVIPHENYDSEMTDNDIALLELAQPVQFNEAISPVCLPFTKEGSDMSGLMGTVTGWGTTSSGGDDSEILLEVDIPLLTTAECKNYLGQYITDNMMCTYEEGKDACQGDSGGPLVSDMSNNDVYYQVGVVSWGVGCGDKDFPGVYAKVENYLDWIVSNTDGNFCRK